MSIAMCVWTVNAMMIGVGKNIMFIFFTVCSILAMTDAQYMKCNYFVSPTDVTANSVIKTIRIPMMKSQTYLPNQHCEWNIQTENPDHVVVLFVDECRIEGPDFKDECSRDYIDFYDVEPNGDTKLKKRICGDKSGTRIESSSNQMMVHFVSDIRFEFSGFHLKYSSEEPKTIDFSPNYVNLAVGLGVGIPGMFCAIIGAAAIYVKITIWRTKKTVSSPHRNRIPPQEQQLGAVQHPQLMGLGSMMESNSPPQPQGRDGSGTIPSSNYDVYNDEFPLRNQQDTHQNLPLRVSLPEYSTADDSSSSQQIQLQDISWNSNSNLNSQFHQVDRGSHSQPGVRTTADGGGGDDGNLVNGRSPTPPPPYELAVRYERVIGPSRDTAALQQPPDYESVVKDDPLNYLNGHSAV